MQNRFVNMNIHTNSFPVEYIYGRLQFSNQPAMFQQDLTNITCVILVSFRCSTLPKQTASSVHLYYKLLITATLFEQVDQTSSFASLSRLLKLQYTLLQACCRGIYTTWVVGCTNIKSMPAQGVSLRTSLEIAIEM